MKATKLLLPVLLATGALAQNAPEHTCRILFLDRPAGAPRTLHLFDGVSSQEVELPGMNLSPVYRLRPGQLRLNLLPAPATDPKAVSPDAPVVEVPATYADFYLLVSSDQANKVAPVRMTVVNANNDKLARGQMLWFNLTDKAVAGTVGGEHLTLRPGEREIVKEPRSGKGDYSVDLYFLIKGDDFVHPLCETRWRHDPRSRSIVFAMDKGARRAPTVFAISDFRMPEKK